MERAHCHHSVLNFLKNSSSASASTLFIGIMSAKNGRHDYYEAFNRLIKALLITANPLGKSMIHRTRMETNRQIAQRSRPADDQTCKQRRRCPKSKNLNPML
jgi:hypothetical protein